MGISFSSLPTLYEHPRNKSAGSHRVATADRLRVPTDGIDGAACEDPIVPMAAALARALAADRRAHLVADLRTAPDGLDVQELSRRVGLHANTVRWDLGARAAERAGRAWGRYLVTRPLPLAPVSDEAATEQVVGLLDEQGFSPENAPGEIRMRRCPFHDLAESQPEIVCAVHKGLITGALEELGSELEVAGLDVFVRPDLCVARLSRSPTPTPAGPPDSRPTA